jgi:hypothetical protein
MEENREGLKGKGKYEGKFVPVLNKVSGHKDVLGSGGIAPRILDLDTRLGEWSASRPPATLPPGKEPLVPIG